MRAYVNTRISLLLGFLLIVTALGLYGCDEEHSKNDISANVSFAGGIEEQQKTPRPEGVSQPASNPLPTREPRQNAKAQPAPRVEFAREELKPTRPRTRELPTISLEDEPDRPIAEPRSAPVRRVRPRPSPKTTLPIHRLSVDETKPVPAIKYRPTYKDDFKEIEPAEETSTLTDNRSTFGLDVDTASYTHMRGLVKRDAVPRPRQIRVEEFINYFYYNYPDPLEEEGLIGLHVEAAPSPAHPESVLVRIGLQGKRLEPKERRPLNLVYLVDVSGSMAPEDRLPLAKEALKFLTTQLRDDDMVAIATYAGTSDVALEHTPASQQDRILSAIDQLRAGGATTMGGGMELAYEMAARNFREGAENRIIVLSDGDANIGKVRHRDIASTVRKYVDMGITLSAVGFGQGNYRHKMMSELAKHGQGNNYYVDTLLEAQRLFGDHLRGTLETLARDVKLQVTFNPEVVAGFTLYGYERRALEHHQFRDDAADGGELGVAQQSTAIYELRLHPGARDRIDQWLARVEIRYHTADEEETLEHEVLVGVSDIVSSVAASTPDFQFAAAVALTAEYLRQSDRKKHLNLELMEEIASLNTQGFAERLEFVELLRKIRFILGDTPDDR